MTSIAASTTRSFSEGSSINSTLGGSTAGRGKWLRALPARRLESCRPPIEVRLSQGSTIRVLGNTYSVDSRLTGERVKVKLFVEHLEVWYGQRCLHRTEPGGVAHPDGYRAQCRYGSDGSLLCGQTSGLAASRWGLLQVRSKSGRPLQQLLQQGTGKISVMDKVQHQFEIRKTSLDAALQGRVPITERYLGIKVCPLTQPNLILELI